VVVFPHPRTAAAVESPPSCLSCGASGADGPEPYQPASGSSAAIPKPDHEPDDTVMPKIRGEDA